MANLFQELARDYYQECIRLHPEIDAEFKRSLKIHMRVPVFIDNLAKQFQLIQDLRISKGKPPLDKLKLKEIVYDLTALFINSVQEEARKKYQSEANRIMEEQAKQKLKDLQETANGNPSGDYEELIQKTKEGKDG